MNSTLAPSPTTRLRQNVRPHQAQVMEVVRRINQIFLAVKTYPLWLGIWKTKRFYWDYCLVLSDSSDF